MTPRIIIRVCLVGLFLLAVFYIKHQWSTEAWQANPIYPLVSIISLAMIAGVVFVTRVLPRLGEAAGESLFSSGEEVRQDERMKAAAKMAAGDYEGAILEFEKVLADQPDDPYPISEIAKLRSEKLGQNEEALAFLQEHLEGQEWTTDNASFLMFRMADLHMHGNNYQGAKDILEQVAGNFPGTRHSANARHRINDIEQLEYKAIQSQRGKAVRGVG